MISRREVLKIAGFGGMYMLLGGNFVAYASSGDMPIFALRGDGKVAVIDPLKDEIIRVIETGGKGGTLGSISKDGKFLYVANNAPGNRTVSVIDARRLELIKNIETGSRPKHPVVSPDGGLVAVNHSGLDGDGVRVVFINTSNNQIASVVNLPVSNKEHKGDFTMHGSWSPDGKVYAVGNYADNKFYLIDRNGKILSEVSTSGNPHYFDWKGNQLWVTIEFNEPKGGMSAPQVYIYDVSSPSSPLYIGILKQDIDLIEKQDLARIEGHHGNFTNDGRLFILCNRGASPFEGTTVSVYDANTRREVAKISSQVKGVGHAYITPDGRFAVITQYGDTKFEVIDLQKLQSIKVVDTGVGRHMGHAVFVGHKMYISNRVADSVFVVDTERWEIIKRIQTSTSGQAQGQIVRDFYQVFERVGRAFLYA
ncbi:MAG: cytochrome D1 domain-containing protein [Aquificaceae bacterium]